MCEGMNNHCYWYDHEPIVGEILSFTPPCDVFLQFRMVCKGWNGWIKSEHFAKLYFQRVFCCDGDNNTFHIDLPDRLEKQSFIFGMFGKKMNRDTMWIRLFALLENIANLLIKSMSWKEHFYFKLLFCVGLNNRQRGARDPLEFLKESLTTIQLEFMTNKFKKWGLGNMLKRDLVVGLFTHPNCFIMFRDDGTPFALTNQMFDTFEVLNYSESSVSDTNFQPGIQITGLQDFIQMYESCTTKVKLNQKEILMWEDYLSCVSASTRRRRIHNIHPFQPIIQTPSMTDDQHGILFKEAQNIYHNEVYLKWRPTIEWCPEC